MVRSRLLVIYFEFSFPNHNLTIKSYMHSPCWAHSRHLRRFWFSKIEAILNDVIISHLYNNDLKSSFNLILLYVSLDFFVRFYYKYYFDEIFKTKAIAIFLSPSSAVLQSNLSFLHYFSRSLGIISYVEQQHKTSKNTELAVLERLYFKIKF